MAKTLDHYWDLDSCAWVKHAAVEVPEQASPAEQTPAAGRQPTAVSVPEDGDVRSE